MYEMYKYFKLHLENMNENRKRFIQIIVLILAILLVIPGIILFGEKLFSNMGSTMEENNEQEYENNLYGFSEIERKKTWLIQSNSYPIADSPWPMLGGNPKHTGLSKYNTSDNPGKIKEKFEYDIDYPQPLIGSDEVIYASGSGFIAIYPNGTQKWQTTSGTRFTPVLGSNGIIYFTSQAGLFAIYSSNGTTKWEKRIYAISSPVLDENDIIYFVSRKSNNEILLNAFFPNGTQKWNLSLEGTASQVSFSLYSPAIDDDNNLYVCIGEIAYSVFPNGTLRWKSENEIFYKLSSPSIGSDGTVYIQDFNDMIALYPENGSVKWNRTIKSDYQSHVIPAIGPDGTIYCGTYRLYAFTPNGDLKWKADPPGSESMNSPTIGSDGTIFFGGTKTFFAYNPDGTLKWNILLDYGIQDSSGIINSNGDIYVSGSKFYVIGKTRPSPPVNLNLKSGDSFVNISWSPPADDGGSEVTGYWLFRGETSGNGELMATFDNDTFFYNDTSVVNGITYYYNITAVNAEGESDPTEEQNARPLTHPTPPRNVYATITGDQVLVEWDSPLYNGGAGVTSYDIYRGITIDDMNFYRSVDSIQNSYVDVDLEVGITYYYCLTAHNIAGVSGFSNTASATYRTIPSPPLNLTVTSGNTFARIEWKPPVQNGGSPILRYKVYRSSGEIFSPLVEPEETFYNDTSVENGITYSYNVTAITEIGESDPSGLVTATPMTIPSPPIDLSAECGNGCINLSWSDPETNGGSKITHFILYRSGGGEDDIQETIPLINFNKYRDNKVTNGKTYTYSVSSVNMIGESERSPSVQAMPRGLPTPPMNLSVKYGDGFIHIYWDRPLSNEGAPITGYRIYRNSTPPILVTGDNRDYNDTDIMNGVRFSYAVSALNEVGESEKTDLVWGFPLDIPVEIEPPGPPRNLSIRIDNDMFILEWDSPEYDGGSKISSYRIYRSLSADGYFDMVDSIDSTSWSDNNITGNTEYHYHVTAFNSEHESLPSEKVNAELIVEMPVVEPEENGNAGIYIVFSVISFLILLIIAIGFFLVYRRGSREDEETEDEGDYKQPEYDFDSMSNKEENINTEDDDQNQQ